MESSASCESDAELRQPIILQAAHYAAKSHAIAEWLADWVHNREQRPEIAKEALAQLLHEVIRTTIRQVHDLIAEFNAFAYEVEDLGYDRVDSGHLYMAIQVTKVALADTFELIDFYSREERGGPDGELNALYARSRILDHTTSRRSDHMMKRRMGLALGQVLQEQSNADPCGADVEALGAKLQSVLASMEQHLRPRYVHMYPSSADTPYRVDSSSPTSKGSFGTVQKVIDKYTGDIFAVKTFEDVVGNRSSKKILREIAILEICSHPNLVEFVEAFQAGDDKTSIHIALSPWAPYTLQKFLESFDQERMESCPWFSPDSAKSDGCVYKIMTGLAEGVEYLHNRSIKHKDLKPENILLYQNEDSDLIRPIITDVGVSKIYKPGGSTNFKDSTYEYLAPEQHSMEDSTLKSDIWQLGCCFAALLVVAKNGRTGLEELKDSYIRDEVNCSCAIGKEQAHFIEALGKLYQPSGGKQSLLLKLVLSMLDMDADNRPVIKQVRAVTQRLGSLQGKGKKRSHAGTAV